ncbi:Phospholipid-transporting ATPase 2 [Phytophthora cinnamomi]|uniref:Phospholipid-transporting ATPase 2 n=1 Tax=Phytophthora cinnamomi TaxID=4785 RepID=UPI00355AB767|nr:Phospholipid-transporting ATPase 2 [Phytophthora cinnamomi]KAG6612943.1 Phospholipid-transporting ATPase 2 [Phytophthora cinnamomi]
MDSLMQAFIVVQPPAKPPQPPKDPQHHGDPALMEIKAAIGEETPATHSPASSASASPSPVQEQEQKAALEKEFEVLQARLEKIKLQALVQQDEAAKSYHDRAVENAVL